jgi:hypothetical protein
MQLQKFSPRHPFHILEPGYEHALKKRLGILVVERVDHAMILFRITEPVKRVPLLDSSRKSVTQHQYASATGPDGHLVAKGCRFGVLSLGLAAGHGAVASVNFDIEGQK